MRNDGPGPAGALRADMRVAVRWAGDSRFEGTAGSRAVGTIDGNSKAGLSPPETMLAALAACTAVDVVGILAKRRTPVAQLDIDVTAQRHDGAPRRFTAIHLGYRMAGAGIDRTQALRAIELGVTKYCTVRDSLDPEMPVTWSLELA